VESIEPDLLNGWNISQRASMDFLVSVFGDTAENPSAATFAKLKDVYLNLFPTSRRIKSNVFNPSQHRPIFRRFFSRPRPGRASPLQSYDLVQARRR
jgi:hypothetical protein